MKISTQALLLLWVLYFVQGLPFGFQSKSLPLLLRERGFTLRHIGYANLLSVPWTCKFLVSPFVDRWGAESPWGRRRVWIMPMQCCLIAACLLAASIFDSVELLMPVILTMNVCTATMDVAVDGLALDVLDGDNELGWGNVAQTVGYKMGMVIGGGVLLQMAEMIGMSWPGFFVCMAGIVMLALVPLALYPEASVVNRTRIQASDSSVPANPFGYNRLVPNEYHPARRHGLGRTVSSPVSTRRRDVLERTSTDVGDESARNSATSGAADEDCPNFKQNYPQPKSQASSEEGLQRSDSQSSLRGVVSTLWRQVQTPGGLTTLVVVFSYKFGEAVSDNMFKPYLLDQGFTKTQISMWTGVYGMGFSTAGSLAGGFVVKHLVDSRAQEPDQAAHDGNGSVMLEDAAEDRSNSILLRAVTLASALEAVAQLGRFFAACATVETLSSEHGQVALQGLIMYESFCGGLLTTIIFTYMMASVDKSIGATHYTMLSTVELAGKSIPSIMSGLLAEAVGYRSLFGVGAGCSILFVLFSLGITLQRPTMPMATATKQRKHQGKKGGRSKAQKSH